MPTFPEPPGGPLFTTDIVVIGVHAGIGDVLSRLGANPRIAPAVDAGLVTDADVVVVDVAPDALAATIRALAEAGATAPALAVARDDDDAARAIAAGADDVIAPDAGPIAVAARVRSLGRTHELERLLTDASAVLEDRVRERTRELDEARAEILDRLVIAAEYRDDDTRDHTRRVGETSGMLATATGLAGEQAATVRLAAPLHDVGKIGVSDATLLKPGPLSKEQVDEVRRHTVIGGRILWGSRAPVLKAAQEIAMFHHERWDGDGYPAGLAGESIPLTARIVAVADVFDALTHQRPYKERWPVARALEELRMLRGTHLDPDLTDAFVEMIESGALDTIEWS